MVDEIKRLNELLQEVVNRSSNILEALSEEMEEIPEPLIITISINESGLIPLDKNVERIVRSKLISVTKPRQEKKWYIDTIIYEEIITDNNGKIIKQKEEILLE